MASNYDLENDKFIERWLNGLSKRTKENYLREIPLFLAFVEMSPTQIIEKRLKDLSSGDLIERTFFENKWRQFKESLEQTGKMNYRTVNTLLTCVASFFSRNDLKLSLKKGDWKSTLETSVIKKFELCKDDVKALYAHASLRDRSLLLVLAQSGLSEVDTANLKIEDFPELYTIAEGQHLAFVKPREKTGQPQATCLSYEAIHDLRAMLQERHNPTEGNLFVSTTKEKGSKLETRRINEAMQTLAQKTFSKEKAKEFKTKALRSFYNSALLRSGIQSEIKDLMMGHRRAGARAHYSYDSQTILDNYSKAFEHLSVNGIQTRNDIKQIKEQMNQLVGKQQVEIEDLKQQIREVNQQQTRVNDLLQDLIGKIEQSNIKTKESIESTKQTTEKVKEATKRMREAQETQ